MQSYDTSTSTLRNAIYGENDEVSGIFMGISCTVTKATQGWRWESQLQQTKKLNKTMRGYSYLR